jgi:surface polysaccharide O-acyltransferase-like enzyme
MYLFLPVINKGIERLTKSELRMIFISLIFFFVIMKDYMNPNSDPFTMNGGYSVVWLLICYLIGAYFGKFKHDYHGIKKFIHYFVYIIMFYYSTILCYKIPNKSIMYGYGYYKIKLMTFLKSIFVMRISSVPMILQSICVLLLFTQIKYNQYLAKIITFIGPLTFGVYLIHENQLIKEIIMKNIFKKEPYNLTLRIVIKLVLLKGLKLFGICAFIDYLRHISFTVLRIRKICIFIEKIMFKIVNFF